VTHFRFLASRLFICDGKYAIGLPEKFTAKSFSTHLFNGKDAFSDPFLLLTT